MTEKSSALKAMLDAAKQPIQAIAESKPVQVARAMANSKGGQELGGWVSHGSSEIGNFIINGHAAPVYAGHSAPAEQQTASLATTPETHASSPETHAPSPETHQGNQQETPSQLDTLSDEAHRLVQVLKRSDLPNLKLDFENVEHSDPITPQPTPAVNRQNEMSR